MNRPPEIKAVFRRLAPLQRKALARPRILGALDRRCARWARASRAMPNKTDRNDARAIAQIVRTGWFRAVHVKTSTCRSWRSLLVARPTVLNEMRSIENVVRAIMRETGLKPGTPARKHFVVRARELIEDEHGLARMIEPLLEILGTMLREFARLTKQVLDIVRDEPICRRLMSAPGVGPLTALRARLFMRPRIRCWFAAKWSSVRARGMKIAKRRGMARARVAVARKLVTIPHRMSVDGAEFRFGSEKAAAASKMIVANV